MSTQGKLPCVPWIPWPFGHRDLVIAVAHEIGAGLEVHRVFGDIG